MWIILVSIVVAVVVAAGMEWALWSAEKPIYEVRALPTARVGDPGSNLVGPDWSGLYRVSEPATRVSDAGGERH
jgi:hypothetical protein